MQFWECFAASYFWGILGNVWAADGNCFHDLILFPFCKHFKPFYTDAFTTVSAECMVLQQIKNQAGVPHPTRNQRTRLTASIVPLISSLPQRWPAAHLSDLCPAKLTHSCIHQWNSTKTHALLLNSITMQNYAHHNSQAGLISRGIRHMTMLWGVWWLSWHPYY